MHLTMLSSQRIGSPRTAIGAQTSRRAAHAEDRSIPTSAMNGVIHDFCFGRGAQYPMALLQGSGQDGEPGTGKARS
jgi:hypothetical protein